MPKFFKHDKNDTIFWANGEHLGELLFTFDKKRVFNLFKDYPERLTPEEREVFDKENPFWKNYFANREAI